MFVRKLENEDWKAYKALRLEALRLHADKYGSSYEENVGRSDAEWQDDLCGASQAFFGLFDGDEMVGSGGIFMKGEASKCGILIGGYIRKEYRGKGYSRLIYEARIEWARDSGLFDRLPIGHRKGNEASRTAWELQRRQRLRSGIQLGVDAIDRRLDGDRANVEFIQRYQAGSYRDTGRKELVLVKRDTDWVIVSESWKPLR